MKAIISMVLSQEEAVGHASSAYIDDIYINEDIVPSTRVRERLAQFRLEYGWRTAHRYWDWWTGRPCAARWLSPWGMVHRQLRAERVGRCLFFSDRSSFGEHETTGGRILSTARKRCPTYHASRSGCGVGRHQYGSPLARQGAARKNKLYACITGYRTLTGKVRVYTKAANEMLLRKWMNTLKELVKE